MIKSEDSWKYQKIGTPFPPNVQKAPGQANKYVAMWQKDGKYVMGRAWNDGGVVQCTFVFDNRIYNGSNIREQIQLLIYEPNLAKKGNRYDWIPYNKSQPVSLINDVVKVGGNTPTYCFKEELLGNLDNATGIATFVTDSGKVKIHKDSSALHVLCKLPGCVATPQQTQDRTLRMPLNVNDWEDYNWGAPWPEEKPVMFAPKKNGGEQYVALWYRHGKPIMGRAWPSNGRIEASFVDSNREFTGSVVGSLQLLIRLPPTSAGYDYVWLPYDQAMDFRDKDHLPLHLSYVCSALLPVDGVYYLGKLDMKTEKADVAVNGKIIQMEGGQVKSLIVLCRKEQEDTMLV